MDNLETQAILAGHETKNEEKKNNTKLKRRATNQEGIYSNLVYFHREWATFSMV